MNLNAYLKNPFRIFFHFNSCKLSHLLPDELLIKLIFRARLGYSMDFNNPLSFNQKIQWLKLNNKNPFYTSLVDKYEVRKYIAKTIGEDYLIPIFGVFNKFDEIDLFRLPDQFVIKCTHDSGSVIVCRNKDSFETHKAKKYINDALKKNFYFRGREWPYKNVKPRIIVEKYMEEKESNGNDVQGLTDYKFYCFNGKVEYLYVSRGLERHETARISFLNLDWTCADFHRADYKPFEKLPAKPKNFEKMIELSEVLSKGFPFLRVDLYEINGKIYFSELTFSPGNGFMPFVPRKKDFEIGKMIELPKE